MDEGWTRYVFDTFQIQYRSVSDADIRSGKLDLDTLVFASESERSIVQGLNAQRYPAEISGGITEAGAERLKDFVENGGKIVCFDALRRQPLNRADDLFQKWVKSGS